VKCYSEGSEMLSVGRFEMLSVVGFEMFSDGGFL